MTTKQKLRDVAFGFAWFFGSLTLLAGTIWVMRRYGYGELNVGLVLGAWMAVAIKSMGHDFTRRMSNW